MGKGPIGLGQAVLGLPTTDRQPTTPSGRRELSGQPLEKRALSLSGRLKQPGETQGDLLLLGQGKGDPKDPSSLTDRTDLCKRRDPDQGT